MWPSGQVPVELAQQGDGRGDEAPERLTG